MVLHLDKHQALVEIVGKFESRNHMLLLAILLDLSAHVAGLFIWLRTLQQCFKFVQPQHTNADYLGHQTQGSHYLQ